MSHSETKKGIVKVEYVVLNEDNTSLIAPKQETTVNECCKFRTPLQSPCPSCRRIRRISTHSCMD